MGFYTEYYDEGEVLVKLSHMVMEWWRSDPVGAWGCINEVKEPDFVTMVKEMLGEE